MGGGRLEVHRDSDYLATGTHRGANGTTLIDPTANFSVFVAQTGLYIENVTTGEHSTILALNDLEITTTDGITWNSGDTYKIYKTSSKNSLISKEWTDSSRGWKSDKRDLVDGWLPEDIDIDRDNDGGRKKVFGRNQPETH